MSLLNFVGHGSAFDAKVNSSAYFMRGTHLVIIDCGENTFAEYKKIIDENDKIEEVHALITHTHADHVNGLSTLSHYLYYVKKTPLVICCHEELKEDIKTLMRINGNVDEQFSINTFSPQISISQSLGHLYSRFVETEHVQELKCYGILLSYKGERIYFSGDSKSIPKEILERLKNGMIDSYYQDISKFDFEGNPHMSIDRFVKEYKKQIHSNVKVYLYHGNDYNPTKPIEI